ncbi:Uncharacterized protein CPATCC_0011820 [Cryptosporidium parvum]|uniref:Hikeshi-like domain-containing protein n=1 Tax=Cryptosporidium parvum TaxID=5807 RepID=A0A7S7RFJ2_CRYPV|nr:Uncharacterized protein CPATCC_0011820 [Cryptosporidium parvum]WKS78145.1 hypothetical protein CPCDC_6g340 [Cryptosporidium sp. 43IA8]|eukprot:QOY40914.1 hypothetical protein CPATCC_002531 [Cryptosporidium parvum]
MNTNFCAGNCNSNIISIIVPGRNPETVINEGNGIVSTIVQNPQTVSNVVVAANGEVFTGDSGAGVYFSFFPYQSWEFLGVLTNLRRSDMFTTGWPFLEGISSIPSVKIIVLIEPANILLQKLETKPPIDYNKEIARKIALNLFRFIESYNSNNNNNNNNPSNQIPLNLPQYILDRWISRFDEKYKLDPYFYMKTN